MREDVARDLSRSAAAFKDVVWPLLGPKMGGGQVIPVESVSTSGFSKDLDIKAGIDAWVTYGNTHMRGIASRVQWVRGRPFKTFTVRMARLTGAKTEYEKQRLRIATPGAIFPYFTVQAYMRCTCNKRPCVCEPRACDFLVATAATTSDVIGAVGRGVGYEQTNQQDRTTFWCVPWRALYDDGAEMWWAQPTVKEGAA